MNQKKEILSSLYEEMVNDESMDYKTILDINENIDENFNEYVTEWMALREEGGGNEGGKTGIFTTLSNILKSRKTLFAIALTLGAYLIYRAIKNKTIQCLKRCKTDPACIYKCRIDYYKGVIKSLERTRSDLSRAGNLTDTKKESIEKAIKKAKTKIANYEKRLKSLKKK